jgi:hypothetical protein
LLHRLGFNLLLRPLLAGNPLLRGLGPLAPEEHLDPSDIPELAELLGQMGRREGTFAQADHFELAADFDIGHHLAGLEARLEPAQD